MTVITEIDQPGGLYVIPWERDTLVTVITESPTRHEKLTIAGHVGSLGFVFGLTGLASIPIQYFLKDRQRAMRPILRQKREEERGFVYL